MRHDIASPVLPVIPGVRPAEQARSRALQDRFARAGREMLRDQRLREIGIPDLARRAQSSVGGFYSRFETKEAFFEFLRARMLAENTHIHDDALAPDRIRDATAHEISVIFVDTMIGVFSGPWRGVLREAYASIPDQQGSWGPMNARGHSLREKMTELLLPRLPQSVDLRERIAFAVQALFGVLNNELMNPYLELTSGDPRLRGYLVDSFCHMVGAAPADTA